MTEWEQAVFVVIASLRKGEVVSYGDVARRAGNPKAARSVGRLLSSTTHPLPWWRVIRSDGTLLMSHRKKQTELLTAEGVIVNAGRVRKAPLGRFS